MNLNASTVKQMIESSYETPTVHASLQIDYLSVNEKFNIWIIYKKTLSTSVSIFQKYSLTYSKLKLYPKFLYPLFYAAVLKCTLLLK